MQNVITSQCFQLCAADGFSDKLNSPEFEMFRDKSCSHFNANATKLTVYLLYLFVVAYMYAISCRGTTGNVKDFVNLTRFNLTSYILTFVLHLGSTFCVQKVAEQRYCYSFLKYSSLCGSLLMPLAVDCVSKLFSDHVFLFALAG